MSASAFVTVVVLVGFSRSLSQTLAPTTAIEKNLSIFDTLATLVRDLFAVARGSKVLRIGGRTLTDYVNIILKASVNSFLYYLKLGIYASDQTKEASITIHCRNRTTSLTSVSVNSIRNVINLSTGSRLLIAIHGWTDSKDSFYFGSLIQNFLEREPNGSICIIDWSPLSQTELLTVAEPESFTVARVGFRFVKATIDLGKEPSNISIVGHSLGAHIAGIIGNSLQETYNIIIDTIIGCDQPGPGWQTRWNSNSTNLNPQSARYVQTIVSNAGVIGAFVFQQVGFQSFICNAGGPSQPGCGLADVAICPHYRSIEYFIYSLKSGCDFKRVRCDDFRELTAGKCTGAAVDKLGFYGDKKVSGKFQVYTDFKIPFCLKEAASGNALDTKYRTFRMTYWTLLTQNFGTYND